VLNSWPDSLLQQTERAVLVLVGGGHLLGVWPVREEPEASNLGMRQVGPSCGAQPAASGQGAGPHVATESDHHTRQASSGNKTKQKQNTSMVAAAGYLAIQVARLRGIEHIQLSVVGSHVAEGIMGVYTPVH
jgi:hypothetical protein